MTQKEKVEYHAQAVWASLDRHRAAKKRLAETQQAYDVARREMSKTEAAYYEARNRWAGEAVIEMGIEAPQ